MPTWSALSFQDSSSPLMEQLIMFHDHAMTILVLIITIVGYNMNQLVTNSAMDKNITESQPLELFWTVIPAFILMSIGLPSIKLFYLLDKVFSPSLTLKTIGHQWYWSYEYSDFSNIEFDSYMIPITDLENNVPRLISTDNNTVNPMKAQVRYLITAADVLHSWTIPSLGVEVDAVPGRLNQINFFTFRPGLFHGQCSEICGANHSFMPITIESVIPKSFVKWIKKNIS